MSSAAVPAATDELRAAVLARLDKTGMLTQTRAQMRQVVYESLIRGGEENGQVVKVTNREAHEVVREYLKAHGAMYALKVLDSEMPIKEEDTYNQTLPSLETILTQWKETPRGTDGG